MPLDEAQIRNECQILKQRGITDIAVVGVFSPLDISGKQEARVREIVLEEIPGADVVLSRESRLLIFTNFHIHVEDFETKFWRSRSTWLPGA